MISKKLTTLILLLSFANASMLNFYYLKKSQTAYRNKEYSKALEYLKDFDDNLDYINYNRANIYYKQNEFQHALKYYKRAYGSNVNEVSRLFNLGNTYIKLKEYDNAIISYEKALTFSNDSDIKNNLELAILLKKKFILEEKRSKLKGKKRFDNNKVGTKQGNKEINKKETSEIRKLYNKNLKSKKIPILMYKINSTKDNSNLNPW